MSIVNYIIKGNCEIHAAGCRLVWLCCQITHDIRYRNAETRVKQRPEPHLNIKTVFSGLGILIIKIQWSWNLPIIINIPILKRLCLYIETHSLTLNSQQTPHILHTRASYGMSVAIILENIDSVTNVLHYSIYIYIAYKVFTISNMMAKCQSTLHLDYPGYQCWRHV